MIKNILHIAYHVFVVLLSAALALSLPFLLSSLAGGLLRAWVFIENEKFFLMALELVTAVLLILFFNDLKRSWEERKLAKMANTAGLVLAAPPNGVFMQRRMKRMKRDFGYARELMIIGSTGSRTFAEPDGDLHEAIGLCRDAKIMLLNPFAEGAVCRAQSIPDQEITPEVIREQIFKSIHVLKALRASQKSVRLKLYPEPPLLKLAVVGDYAFLQHYHTGLNVRDMPEYAFKNAQKHGGLYVFLNRYFLSRWQDPHIPEYDLDTDELVYRDPTGGEVRRERFGETPSPEGGDVEQTG